jgi:hypothetical protein
MARPNLRSYTYSVAIAACLHCRHWRKNLKQFVVVLALGYRALPLSHAFVCYCWGYTKVYCEACHLVYQNSPSPSANLVSTFAFLDQTCSAEQLVQADTNHFTHTFVEVSWSTAVKQWICLAQVGIRHV